ncbi:hypothetical protein GUJ93_ZPchr0007g3671 [Zizania palustris]|uniref:Uncharacterized protein n=1 Tax=Zizania palustris TaxID=103762 RepID=A0A8J5SPM0_ZIZPA|nr:hypothetical protein GUJ93_ZPchr0007g3671 [Zizania palustris]KAG8077705.1 hypothetical protein GUJ93_ZPchr0007g3671 [Zizania palustris]
MHLHAYITGRRQTRLASTSGNRPAAGLQEEHEMARQTAMLAAAVERAEAGQNCICECVKLCTRTRIPAILERQCAGKCMQGERVRPELRGGVRAQGLSQARPRRWHPQLRACELEPLTTDEEHMRRSDHWPV